VKKGTKRTIPIVLSGLWSPPVYGEDYFSDLGYGIIKENVIHDDCLGGIKSAKK
jgi:hypothetical protein